MLRDTNILHDRTHRLGSVLCAALLHKLSKVGGDVEDDHPCVHWCRQTRTRRSMSA